jgi:hypothetical protein
MHAPLAPNDTEMKHCAHGLLIAPVWKAVVQVEPHWEAQLLQTQAINASASDFALPQSDP